MAYLLHVGLRWVAGVTQRVVGSACGGVVASASPKRTTSPTRATALVKAVPMGRAAELLPQVAASPTLGQVTAEPTSAPAQTAHAIASQSATNMQLPEWNSGFCGVRTTM